MSSKIQSCSNYYCEGYKNNTCERALEHRLKLYEKRLDDNKITPRSNTKFCELRIIPKDKNDR